MFGLYTWLLIPCSSYNSFTLWSNVLFVTFLVNGSVKHSMSSLQQFCCISSEGSITGAGPRTLNSAKVSIAGTRSG